MPPVPDTFRSMRWQKSERFRLSDDDEDGRTLLTGGPIYGADEVTKLDLFHRSHSLMQRGLHRLVEEGGDSDISDVDEATVVPTNRPFKSPCLVPDKPDAPALLPQVATAQKGQIRNLLMGITGRQKPNEPVPASETSRRSSVSVPITTVVGSDEPQTPFPNESTSRRHSTPQERTFAASEALPRPSSQRARLGSMLMMGMGLAARRKSVKPASPSPPTDHPDTPLHEFYPSTSGVSGVREV